MADLVLGPQRDRLTLHLWVNDRWDSALSLEDETGSPKPWPAAPTIVFSDGSSWVSVLSEGGTLATWSCSEALVTQAVNRTDRSVRLRVDGVTWWRGQVKVHAS